VLAVALAQAAGLSPLLLANRRLNPAIYGGYISGHQSGKVTFTANATSKPPVPFSFAGKCGAWDPLLVNQNGKSSVRVRLFSLAKKGFYWSSGSAPNLTVSGASITQVNFDSLTNNIIVASIGAQGATTVSVVNSKTWSLVHSYSLPLPSTSVNQWAQFYMPVKSTLFSLVTIPAQKRIVLSGVNVGTGVIFQANVTAPWSSFKLGKFDGPLVVDANLVWILMSNPTTSYGVGTLTCADTEHCAISAPLFELQFDRSKFDLNKASPMTIDQKNRQLYVPVYRVNNGPLTDVQVYSLTTKRLTNKLFGQPMTSVTDLVLCDPS
jgi:hypothetical protein